MEATNRRTLPASGRSHPSEHSASYVHRPYAPQGFSPFVWYSSPGWANYTRQKRESTMLLQAKDAFCINPIHIATHYNAIWSSKKSAMNTRPQRTINSNWHSFSPRNSPDWVMPATRSRATLPGERRALNDRTYAVALSNAALPAAAWYFPTVVRFSLCERKTNNKKKIQYRCA
jgi:hypothetical protein